MSKTKKVVHKNKSKEELIEGLKKNQKWVAKMEFTRNKFYPALLEVDTDIDDIKMFLSSISSIILEKFLAKMKEDTTAGLDLPSLLDKKDKNYEQYVTILKLFDNYSAIYLGN